MSSIWSETLLLMALGMGTVFIFLLTLIFSLTLMSAVIKRISPQAHEENHHPEIAAIASAAYRAHTRKK